MTDTSAEAVERAVKKLTRLGQIGRESAANSLPITGVTNRDGLSIAATLHALLIERDTYRRELQATSQQADMLMAALDEWRDEPPGGFSKGGVLYLSPERVAAERNDAIQRGDDWCDQVQKIRAERDMWRAENAKKVTACEQMGARITALEAERDAHRDAHAAAQNVLDALYGERDRLREAVQILIANVHMHPTVLTAALDIASTALKETGHE
jgi:hypothetical protein